MLLFTPHGRIGGPGRRVAREKQRDPEQPPELCRPVFPCSIPMDGHVDGAGAVVVAHGTASKEPLLPQIGQAPHLVARQARLPRGLVLCFNMAARASRWLFLPPAETALMET